MNFAKMFAKVFIGFTTFCQFEIIIFMFRILPLVFLLYQLAVLSLLETFRVHP